MLLLGGMQTFDPFLKSDLMVIFLLLVTLF